MELSFWNEEYYFQHHIFRNHCLVEKFLIFFAIILLHFIHFPLKHSIDSLARQFQVMA